MSKYNFGNLYIEEKESVVADALSRKQTILSHIPLKVDLRERVGVGSKWVVAI